jgi:hypothetical protein
VGSALCPFPEVTSCFGNHCGRWHALWDDIKFSTTHCTQIERIALVGNKKWEEWMAKVCKPFTMAKVKYFDAAQLASAWSWLAET